MNIGLVSALVFGLTLTADRVDTHHAMAAEHSRADHSGFVTTEQEEEEEEEEFLGNSVALVEEEEEEEEEEEFLGQAIALAEEEEEEEEFLGSQA